MRSAAQRDLDVLFTVYGAPAWAEGPNRPDRPALGSWKPDPQEFGSFASALATRYSGRFPDPTGPGTLPKVRSYEAWNEPNLGWFFLAPQWEDGRALGATMYRELLNSFYDAVHEVDPTNVVVGGATSPFGNDRVDARAVRRPLAFLRSLFCLKGRRHLEPQQCPGVRMDVLSHHALSHERQAGYNAINPDDAASGDLNRVERVLRAAERAGAVQPGGKRPIWVTEFWWISDPPAPTEDSAAIPERDQARNIARALYRYWRDRAHVAIQYLIRDPGGGSPWNTGLFFEGGKPKLALQAFRFPFVSERLRRKRVRTWGISPANGRVRIQGRRGGGWRTLKRLRAREGKVFTARLRGMKRMRAQIGDETSLAWSNRGKGGG